MPLLLLSDSQDTRRARADRSQGEGLATASPDDDDDDNVDDSEGQRNGRMGSMCSPLKHTDTLICFGVFVLFI